MKSEDEKKDRTKKEEEENLELMESKYAVIDDIKAQKRYEDSPVEILRFEILQNIEDGKKFLRYTMKNIGEKVIKAVHISIFCYDSYGNKTDEIAGFEYKTIFAKKEECFGEDCVIPLTHMISEKFDLYINHVFFEDKTVWNSIRILNLEHPQRLMSEHPSFEVMKFACRKAGIARQAKYVPDIIDRFWRCTCGQMNQSNANHCINCKVDRTVLNEVFHAEHLKQMQKMLEKEKKKMKEEKIQERNEQIKQKVEKNTENIKQWGKLAIPIMAGVIVLAIAAFIGTKFVFPAYYYEKAQKQLEAGQYILAQRQFEKSKNYKNARQFEKYSSVLSEIEQIKDESNLGEIYNEVVELDGFQGSNMILDENSYLKQIKSLQGEWNLYDGGKKRTYKFSDGNITINGQNIYQIVAIGKGIGLRSGERGEIWTVTSVDENEILMETEAEAKVFHRKDSDESSIYFPVKSYETILQKTLQDKHKIVDKMKKNSSIYACLNLIEYLYGEGYAQFVKLEKVYIKNLNKAKTLMLDDATVVEYKKEVHIDVIGKAEDLKRKNQRGVEVKIEHYIGYFDEKGENLVAYNKIEKEISDQENNRKLAEKFNSYDIPNITIPICKQVIETEMQKDTSLENNYCTVTAVSVEKSAQNGMLVHIWGSDCTGANRRIDGVVNYTYQIESTSSQEEQFDKNAYVETPVYDYAEELAAYLK